MVQRFISLDLPSATTDAAFQKQNGYNSSQTTISRQYQQAQRQQAEKQQNAPQQIKQVGTSNAIPDTAEGKKKSLAIAQEAYQQTKNR